MQVVQDQWDATRFLVLSNGVPVRTPARRAPRIPRPIRRPVCQGLKAVAPVPRK